MYHIVMLDTHVIQSVVTHGWSGSLLYSVVL